MSEFPGRIELLTSDSTSRGAQSSQAAIFGAAAFPLYPFHLPRRRKSGAAWVWPSTYCTWTSTYRPLRRTNRKPSSGLGSTQGGTDWYKGGIAPGCFYLHGKKKMQLGRDQGTAGQSHGEGGIRGWVKPHTQKFTCDPHGLSKTEADYLSTPPPLNEIIKLIKIQNS